MMSTARCISIICSRYGGGEIEVVEYIVRSDLRGNRRISRNGHLSAVS